MGEKIKEYIREILPLIVVVVVGIAIFVLFSLHYIKKRQ